MRTVFALLFAALFSACAIAQYRASVPRVHIRHLQIEASGLSPATCEAIVRQLQGGTYPADEVRERIRAFVQDLGYYNAEVNTLNMVLIREEHDAKLIDATYEVEPGAKYTISGFHFTHATVFPPEKLRSAFPVSQGDIFSRISIGKGLENLRRLYLAAGYLNQTNLPDVVVDETNKTLSFTIDIDEGKPFRFGQLILDGPEPHAGAGKALLQSWEKLEGKPYNPEILEQWLKDSSRYFSPNVSPTPSEIAVDDEAQVVTVMLRFP